MYKYFSPMYFIQYIWGWIQQGNYILLVVNFKFKGNKRLLAYIQIAEEIINIYVRSWTISALFGRLLPL